MQLKKNTKAFKTIKEIVIAAKNLADRQKFIRLYITRAGHSIKDRIRIESMKGDADLFYNMNYDAILNNLQSSDRQLHESDEAAGIFFFHSTSNKTWDETPFEFDESIRKEFHHLEELPTTRKKDKSASFSFATMEGSKIKADSKANKKAKPESKKVVEEVPRKTSNQPDYSLKHRVEFTNLEQIVFRGPQLSRKDILDYYNTVADQMLLHLKGRPLTIQAILNGRNVEYNSPSSFPEYLDLPDWSRPASNSKKNGPGILLCNDKDHLLLFAELGGIQFDHALSKIRSATFPEYIIIAIDSPDIEVNKAVRVALVAREILSGLRLPSFVKSDGLSGLHIYIPLDSKSDFQTCKMVAEYLCKMIRIKKPDDVALESSADKTYGKVLLEYSLNEEGKRVIVPYSLTMEDSPGIAVPLHWDELTASLQLTDFNMQNIGKRLKLKVDPFHALSKKKINAGELLARLEENYTFLF